MGMEILAAPLALLVYGIVLIIPILILYLIIKFAVKHAIIELKKEGKI